MIYLDSVDELLEFAYQELAAEPLPAKKRPPTRNHMMGFNIDPPVQRMLSLLVDKMKEQNRLAGFEYRQDYLRRLVLMEFTTEFCSKKKISGMKDVG